MLLAAERVTKKEEEEDRVWLVCVAVGASSLWLVAGRGCALAWLVARKLIACYLWLEMLLMLSEDVEERPADYATGEPTSVSWAPVSSTGLGKNFRNVFFSRICTQPSIILAIPKNSLYV